MALSMLHVMHVDVLGRRLGKDVDDPLPLDLVWVHHVEEEVLVVVQLVEDPLHDRQLLRLEGLDQEGNRKLGHGLLKPGLTARCPGRKPVEGNFDEGILHDLCQVLSGHTEVRVIDLRCGRPLLLQLRLPDLRGAPLDAHPQLVVRALRPLPAPLLLGLRAAPLLRRRPVHLPFRELALLSAARAKGRHVRGCRGGRGLGRGALGRGLMADGGVPRGEGRARVVVGPPALARAGA
mmetsp:Transcript_17035/g.49851  ORF Transcript_17035/g.49851 Transcript_17035/m.49851 type:complete len:235 (+) Transcript_17035:617-1321(+)